MKSYNGRAFGYKAGYEPAAFRFVGGHSDPAERGDIKTGAEAWNRTIDAPTFNSPQEDEGHVR